MAGELVDPEQAKALMDAVNRSRAEADRLAGIPEHRQFDWGEAEDALARASAGMNRPPLPPEYFDSEYMNLLGGYDAPYMDVRAALNRNPHYREDYDAAPRSPFGYPDFGGDVFGTVGEQVMSMMPPQEPLPPRILAELSQDEARARAELEAVERARAEAKAARARAEAEWAGPVPPRSLRDLGPEPSTGPWAWDRRTKEGMPPMPPPTFDPRRAARIEELIRELEETQPDSPEEILQQRLRTLGR